LPDDAQAPSLNKFSLSDLQLWQFGANGKMDEVDFTTSWQKSPALSLTFPGVAQ
jgi:HAE1 family hydrophobic/amphiphilic exporter-1